MSRQVKRVPLDFAWPLDEVWSGYLMPPGLRSIDCPVCGGSGLSRLAKLLYDQWYGHAPFHPEQTGSSPFTTDNPNVRAFAERNVTASPGFYGSGERAIVREAERLCGLWNAAWSHHLDQPDVDALIAEDRLWDLTRRWDRDERRWIEIGHQPTAQEVNGWSIRGFGHDAINQWIVVRAACKRFGIERKSPACAGAAHVFRDEEHRTAHDAWAASEPPPGDGWQVWETVSEGSPISPVFSTPEDLAAWMAASSRSDGAGYDQWLAMIVGPGWAPSAVSVAGELLTGVVAVTADKLPSRSQTP